jgi:hypothetical protein
VLVGPSTLLSQQHLTGRNATTGSIARGTLVALKSGIAPQAICPAWLSGLALDGGETGSAAALLYTDFISIDKTCQFVTWNLLDALRQQYLLEENQHSER